MQHANDIPYKKGYVYRTTSQDVAERFARDLDCEGYAYSLEKIDAHYVVTVLDVPHE